MAKRVRTELAQRFAVQFERPRKQRVIVPAGAAHPVQQVIDFVHERFEQGASRCFDVREQRAERRRFGETDTRRERADDFLAVGATALEDVSLVFDLAAETEYAIGVTFEKTFLLLLEEAEEFAVFSEFLPETFSDALPVHIRNFPTFRRWS